MQLFYDQLVVSPDSSIILARKNNEIDFLQFSEKQPFLSASFQELIYAAAWYPFMRFDHENCFLVAQRDSPTKLIDTFSLQPRASYVSRDHLDQIVAPNALLFSLDASRIFSGFKNAIHLHDISVPGDSYTLIKTSESKKESGQKGIVSALENINESTFVAGTFSGELGIYSNGVLENYFYAESGVTQITKYLDYLVVGYRKCDFIDVFDIRTFNIVRRLERKAMTNQRMYFDISQGMLGTGSTDGVVSLFDIKAGEDKVREFRIGEHSVPSVQFSKDSTCFVACCGDREGYSDETLVSFVSLEIKQSGS